MAMDDSTTTRHRGAFAMRADDDDAGDARRRPVASSSTALDASARAFAPSRATTTARATTTTTTTTRRDERGRKGQRADFLLNFAPRERPDASRRSPARSRRGAREAREARRRRPRGARARERALFLQANFRFLVADSADLRASSRDADRMASWEDVVRVDVASAEAFSCPVCLEDGAGAIAPQTTTCGHSFCFPCIARHVLTTRDQGKPAKCPMCFAEIRLGDLRSVSRRLIAPPSAGRTQKFALMARRRDSNVPVRRTAKETPPPASEAWPRALPDCGCDAFAKYTLTSEEVAIATQELESLESYIAVLTEQSEIDAANELPFALASIDALTRRLDRWVERRCASEGVAAPKPRAPPAGVVAPTPAPAPKSTPREEAFPSLPPPGKNMAYLKGSKVRVESAFTDDEDEDEDEESDSEPSAEDSPGASKREADATTVSRRTPLTVSTSSPPTVAPTATPTSDQRTDVYYFYQAPDGQQVLLHGACMRVLLEQFGAYEALPLEIEGTVIELEHRTQDEDVRRRAAHLRHLPLTTEFVMVELDMKSLVSKKVLDGPAGSELRQRAKRRSQKNAAAARAKAKEKRAEATAKVNSQPFAKSIRDAMPELGATGKLTPDTSMDAAIARQLAEEAEEEMERMSMYEEVQNARGPGGRSFSNIVGLGFASGGPSLNFNTESFGPALGSSAPVAPPPLWGARAAALTETAIEGDSSRSGKKKGKKQVLFRMG